MLPILIEKQQLLIYMLFKIVILVVNIFLLIYRDYFY